MGICPCLLPCVGPRLRRRGRAERACAHRPSLDRVQNQPLDAKQGAWIRIVWPLLLPLTRMRTSDQIATRLLKRVHLWTGSQRHWILVILGACALLLLSRLHIVLFPSMRRDARDRPNRQTELSRTSQQSASRHLQKKSGIVARPTRNPSSKQKRKKNLQVAEDPTVGCSPEMTIVIKYWPGAFNVSKIVPDHSKRNETFSRKYPTNSSLSGLRTRMPLPQWTRSLNWRETFEESTRLRVRARLNHLYCTVTGRWDGREDHSICM